MKSSILFPSMKRIQASYKSNVAALFAGATLALGVFSATTAIARTPVPITLTAPVPFEGTVLRVIEPTLAHKQQTKKMAVEATKLMRVTHGLAAGNAVQAISGSREFAKPTESALAVELDYGALQNSQIGDTLNFALPDGLNHRFVMDMAPLINGDTVTWIGRSSVFGNRFRAMLSTSPAGTFGSIMTPTGEWRISPGGAHQWLVNETAERVNEPKDFCEQSHGYVAGELAPEIEREINARATILPIPPSLKASADKQSGARATPEPSQPRAAIPSPQAVVDLLIVYTPQYATNLGTGLRTRLTALVARANQAYIDSGVAITLRLVHSASVNYNLNDFASNSSTLQALAAGTGVFSAVHALRNQYGADVVAMLRDGPEFSSAGIGGIGGFAGQNYATAINQVFSVTTGCPRGCDVVFIHEIGHNMGGVHDRANAGTPASNGQFGSFPYSFGWGSGTCFITNSCPTQVGSDFGTIMSYQTPTVFKFSNPDELCVTRNGSMAACGVPESNFANQSNVAKAFNNIRQTLSGFRATVVSATLSGSIGFSADVPNSARRDAGSVTLLVTREGGNAGAASVKFATVDSSAIAGIDYTAQSGTLVWADGDATSRNIVVPLLNANTPPPRSFWVFLTDAVAATQRAESIANISIVAPPAPGLQFAASTAAVGENSGSVSIPVKRLNSNLGAVSVTYATANRTAAAGSDYTATSGTLSWANGDTTDKNINVPIANDAIAEGSETFVINLSNPVGATLSAPATVEVTIYDPWPANNVFPAGFIQTPGTAANWALATDSTFEGGFSLRSDAIGNAAISATQITGNFAAGEVSFAYRISSEAGFDFLRFSIDGAERAAFTGETGWAVFSTPITAGIHTLRWSYVKDNLSSGGQDRAWIDAVTMPLLSAGDLVVGARLPYYRLFNVAQRAFFYTTDANENAFLKTVGFSQDGPVGDLLAATGSVGGKVTVPLFRMYSPSLQRHLYTTDVNEYNVLSNLGWNQEGSVGNLSNSPSPLALPFFRLYNPTIQRHLWTTDQNELQFLIANAGWNFDSLIGYLLKR